MAYLLDTGVFIEAKRRFYGLDFCPGYWEWLMREANASTIRSIERVADELGAQQDDLSAWAATLPNGFFLRPDATFSDAFQRVSHWALTSGFHAAAYNEFLDVADSFLIAQALAGAHTVVTLEKPATTPSKKKIKVPDACAGVGVKSMTPYALLRLQGVRFVLSPSTT
ncbi:MAG: DUF4411 family protein [Planctomycetia bacterium]|jgi:hypothetical protein|nr:DUF4411 family protein [Planctomycetia bacterium]MCC7316882.1 DUF4411 family protein [Planctomycetota bacterium]OQZ00437.1 MAG: hypothetical protein B6D36_15140 [Planctomycetes bacterium UTPLA1]